MLTYNFSAKWVIKSFHQLHSCALSTTRFADQCDCLTRIDNELQTIKNFNTAAHWVREMNVREINLAAARLLAQQQTILVQYA